MGERRHTRSRCFRFSLASFLNICFRTSNREYVLEGGRLLRTQTDIATRWFHISSLQSECFLTFTGSLSEMQYISTTATLNPAP